MHTQAPWTRTEGERFKHDNSAGIKGADGLYLAAALDFNRFDRDEEVEANARLIAAAPEMLEALENTLIILDRRPDPEDIRRQQEYIMTVIKKATGG